MNARERALVLLLRVTGAVLVTAFFAIFLPTDWMAWTHRWLGLGTFPESPLVDYLTRSASALYCMHGALMLVLSRDIRRFAPIVVFVAWAGIVFGALMIGVDLAAGLPLYWTVGEGPSIVLVGGATLWLARGIQRPGATPPR